MSFAMFRFLPLSACAFLLAVPVSAELITHSETDIIGRFVNAAQLNIRDYDKLERATISVVRNKEDTFLGDIFVSNTTTGEVVAVARQLLEFVSAWAAAEITVIENGSFQISTNSIGFGRGNFEEVLTFAYREGSFILAGITRTELDRLYAAEFTCDHNLLSGQYNWKATIESNEEKNSLSDTGSGQTAPLRLELANLTRNNFPTECASLSKNFLDRFWQ